MMKAIRTGHSLGNTIRMFKLPLIFVEESLYADAIAQFFLLTEHLEDALSRHEADPMVQRVRALGLDVTPGYVKDLKDFNGLSWRDRADSSMTASTRAYCEILDSADPLETVAAAFILYGALVVGGGKMTQAKVKKIFPKCEHALFDVGEDMKDLRARFKRTFTDIGRDWPEHFERLEQEAARFMQLNNTVVLSIRCWGKRATLATLSATVLGLALFTAWTRSSISSHK